MVWEYECVAHSVLDEPVFFDGKSSSAVTNPPKFYKCSRASDRDNKNFVAPILPAGSVKTHFLGEALVQV